MFYIFTSILSFSGLFLFIFGIYKNEWRLFALGVFFLAGVVQITKKEDEDE